MNAASHSRMSLEAYLAFEETAETKHEFVNGDVVAMAGASPAHSLVRDGIAGALQVAFAAAGRPCVTFSSDTRVLIAETGLYAYPDLTVVCGPSEWDRRANPPSLKNPLVVVEVLSDSTEAYDRGAKWAHYQRRASVQEYVLVSTTSRRVDLFRRRASDSWWESRSFEPGDSVPLASLGIEVPVADLYRQIDLVESMPAQ